MKMAHFHESEAKDQVQAASPQLILRFGAPRKASFVQRVGFPPRQGLASHRESSLAWWEVTNTAKRRPSDQQAATEVKRLSPVKEIEQMPTVSKHGKAPVGAGYGDRAGESAGVGARGMLGKGRAEELGKPIEVSGDE